jgi:CRP/FNR family transcriptional regulator, cyclic AMP receptor protein
MQAFDKRAILRELPLFKGLSPAIIDRLASYAHTKSFSAGAIICGKGDPGDSVFAVCSGTVKISNLSAEGKGAVFALMNAKEIFGEMALLDGQPRSAEALALTDCVLLVIDRRDFIPLVKSEPDLAMRLIEVLCARLRHTSEQVEDVIFLDLPTRLAKTLLWLANQAEPSPQGRTVKITQREIGQIIGMSRESTNKQLRDWEDQKWLRLERGGIAILAPEKLAELAGTEGDTD